MKKFKNAFSKYPNAKKNFRTVIMFFIGFAALIWFLIRVIPKPSRAAYPCMQAAFPFASAFVIWLTGILTSSLLFVKAKAKWRRSKYILAAVLLFLAAFVFMLTSTSIKFTPVIARAYIFTNSLLGNSLPVMQNIAENDSCVVDPLAFIGAVKSSQAYAEDIDSSEIVSMVSLAIERAGGLEGIVSDGDTVILKPNLVVSTAAGQQLNPEVNGITTDYRVMQAVVNIINEINPSGVIYIMEGSASGGTANNMVILNYDQITGVDSLICLEDACEVWGDTTCVYLQGISLPPDNVLYNGADNRYWLHKLYNEADVVISMPVLKNHLYAGTTGSVKNVGIGATPTTIYGNYPGYPTNMRWYIDHNNPPRTNLHYWIHDYFMCRPVDFVIMDGLQSIQNGPTSNTDDQMNMRMILACKDPIAVDAVGSLLTGHDPELVPHLVTLHNDSMGCCDARLIRVNGIKVGDEKKDFEITDTGLLSKYDDFEAPDFSVDGCYITDNMLHFFLTVDEGVTKVEVSIEGIYLNQIVVDGFEDFYIDLDTLEITPGTEVLVYAYDQYLNYSSQYAVTITSVHEEKEIIDKMILCNNIPNPFINSTQITYEVSERTHINLSVYDIRGSLVIVLVNEEIPAGNHNVIWNGTNSKGDQVETGNYFCRLSTSDGLFETKKMIKQ
nr:DUF362 domain-containing protein [Bacteroidota bacterium]